MGQALLAALANISALTPKIFNYTNAFWGINQKSLTSLQPFAQKLEPGSILQITPLFLPTALGWDGDRYRGKGEGDIGERGSPGG